MNTGKFRLCSRFARSSQTAPLDIAECRRSASMKRMSVGARRHLTPPFQGVARRPTNARPKTGYSWVCM